MTERVTRAAAAALLLFVVRAGSGLAADTFSLTNPSPATCIAEQGAVYSVKNGALIAVQGVFSIFPPGQKSLAPELIKNSSAQPGDVSRLYFRSPDRVDAVDIQLGFPGKIPLSQTHGFRASTNGNVELWVALLGIPADAVPRSRMLTLRVTAGERSWLFVEPFTVTTRTFVMERIALSKDLTLLANKPDPRKTAEMKSLARALSTPHPDALFESGPFIDPLSGAHRTGGYGDRREYDYADGTTGTSVHEGLDIGAPQGTPVLACGRGRVVIADTRILTGNTVVIEHLPGLFSIYFHMAEIDTKPGDVVDQGAIIGKVGMTGFATGPHLHWEVQASGVPVDPEALIKAPLLDKNAVIIDTGQRIGTEGR
jgi:hypothetical protein